MVNYSLGLRFSKLRCLGPWTQFAEAWVDRTPLWRGPGAQFLGAGAGAEAGG